MRGQFTTTFWQIPEKKNNYNYVRGNLLFDRFQTKTIITIMWVGNLLPFDRFQRKKIITIMWKGNLLPFDRFQTKKIITIMWEGNLLHFDRFQTKKNYNYARGRPFDRQFYVRGYLLPLTDSRQKKNNYVRGQLQFPDKKKLQLWEGKLLPIDRFQTNIIIIIMWEGNLLHFDRFQTKKIITIMREGNLLPFDRFQTKK